MADPLESAGLGELIAADGAGGEMQLDRPTLINGQVVVQMSRQGFS